MGETTRTRLAALVMLAVVAVPLAILALGGGGDDATPKPKHRATGLRVERGASGSDLTVYVKPAVNVAARTGGRRQVLLKCVDSEGEAVMAQDEAWPFGQTDGGLYDPHAHMTLDPLSSSSVKRCLLEGTEPLLEASVP
jgi:hypothetical protein